MNLEDIAQAYVRCVELEERAQDQRSEFSEELSALRSDLHALLIQALREARIPFTDRYHAAHIAFEIVQHKRVTA